MRKILVNMSLLAILVLSASSSALATIEMIKGTLSCATGCGKNAVQFAAPGEQNVFEVIGQFVDLSTAVQITGADVSVSYGTRKGGYKSSIVVKVNVDDNAAAGEHTVKMRYAYEADGYDSFVIKVVKKGIISQIQMKRPPLRTAASGIRLANPNLPPPTLSLPTLGNITAPLAPLVPAVNIPLNEKVVLVVSGTKLGNVELRPGGNYRDARILPGATDSRCEIEIEFTASGQEPLLLFDAALSVRDMTGLHSTDFSYGGGANRNVQYGGTPTGGGYIPPQIGGRNNGGSNTFVDAAPRVNMLNVFRRTSQNAVFTENGAQYLAIDSQQFCNTMNGDQTRIITVPDLRWGVTNVGTADINTAFAAQLRAGGAVLETENVAGLNPGETRDFTFQRQNSRVRVFTFLNRSGCFISPTADQFFEDPAFTVVINTNNALTEAAANQNNNSRNY